MIGRASLLAPPVTGALCAASLSALALGFGCGSPSYDVPRYPHPENAPAEPVGFLPPPAQIEQRDEKPPAAGCLWADGQWVWAAQRWDWRPGGWVRPPEGCRYSPPTLQWAPGGEKGILYYRPGRWYAVSEPKICADAVSCIPSSPNDSISRLRAPQPANGMADLRAPQPANGVGASPRS